MYIETTEDLCNQIADWIGVYGACKADECSDGCENKNPLCCRVGFMIEMKERMARAVENDRMLELNLNSIKPSDSDIEWAKNEIKNTDVIVGGK